MSIVEGTTRERSAPSFLSVRALFRRVADVSHVVAEWRRRRHYRNELRRLLGVGPHLIADIGLTIEAARREIKKPFWRP